MGGEYLRRRSHHSQSRTLRHCFGVGGPVAQILRYYQKFSRAVKKMVQQCYSDLLLGGRQQELYLRGREAQAVGCEDPRL